MGSLDSGFWSWDLLSEGRESGGLGRGGEEEDASA